MAAQRRQRQRERQRQAPSKRLNHRQASQKGRGQNSHNHLSAELDAILAKHRKEHEGGLLLLPLLWELQGHFGYIPEEVAHELSRKANIPFSKIFGLISFYKMLYYEQQGRHIIRICNSPSCYLNGSLNVITALASLLKIKSGETTKDKRFTLEVVSCIGCCDKAPAMQIDGKLYGNLTPAKLKSILRSFT